MWDGAHQQVVRREIRCQRPEKNQGEARRDERADSLVVGSALADHIEKASICSWISGKEAEP